MMSVKTVFSQETEIYADKNIHFKNGLLLIEEKKYLAAQEEFELLFNQNKLAEDNEAYILKMYASYYYAFSSYKLELPNAERLYTNFLNDFHNNFLRNKAYYDLGNLYFDKNKTIDAIRVFEKIDASELSKEEKQNFWFDK
jgi:TolA-binding protein